MFFSKFFKKDRDHSYYLAQADKSLAAERYADARVDFLEAQSRCPAEAVEAAKRIKQGLCQAGDRLAELNLVEGEHAVNAGEAKKAADHFDLALELANDTGLKARANAGLKSLSQPRPSAAPAKSAAANHSHGGGSCASCGPDKHAQELVDPEESDVHEDDRFFLLVQPLPGDLPTRYAALGEKFVKAYLLIHEGNDAAAFPILKEMLVSSENDIVIYELALIMYRGGRPHECEELLNRALKLNPSNAAVYLALIHLKAETQNFPEAIEIANRMLGLGILPDQALILVGELHEAAGNQADAMEAWSKALEYKTVAKPAAERLVPLLSSQGRDAEAKYLAKQYLKGCC